MNTEQLPDLRKQVADSIKTARKDRALSQKKLAALCGIREQTLIELEKGGNGEMNTLLKVCRELGLKLKVIR